MAQLTPAELEEIRAAKEALNADAAENWNDPAWHKQVAAEITVEIEEGFAHANLLSLLTTVETAADNDRIIIEEIRNLTPHWVAPGGRIERQNWSEDSFELTPDFVGFGLEEQADKMKSGFADKRAKMVAGGIVALDAAVNSRLLSVLKSATSSGTDFYVGSSTFSLSALNTAIAEVADESLSDNVTIVARGVMMKEIFDALQSDSNFAPAAQDQIVSSGYLGRYRGANLVQLRNYRDGNKQSYFAGNELYVVGPDASTVGLWGSLESDTWLTDGVNNKKWAYEARRKAGFVAYRPERMRRFVVTSLPA